MRINNNPHGKISRMFCLLRPKFKNPWRFWDKSRTLGVRAVKWFISSLMTWEADTFFHEGWSKKEDLGSLLWLLRCWVAECNGEFCNSAKWDTLWLGLLRNNVGKDPSFFLLSRTFFKKHVATSSFDPSLCCQDLPSLCSSTVPLSFNSQTTWPKPLVLGSPEAPLWEKLLGHFCICSHCCLCPYSLLVPYITLGYPTHPASGLQM